MKSRQDRVNQSHNSRIKIIQRQRHEDEIKILIEEYKEIRAEINLKQGNTQSITNFALIILAGTIGSLGINYPIPKYYGYIFLISPMLLGILGFCFAYEVYHIVIASAFINRDIRYRMAQMLNNSQSEVLTWEDYKYINSTKLSYIFDLARWSIFILPSIFFITLFFQWISEVNFSIWLPILSVNIMLHLFLLFCFFYRNHYKSKLININR